MPKFIKMSSFLPSQKCEMGRSIYTQVYVIFTSDTENEYEYIYKDKIQFLVSEDLITFHFISKIH